MISIKKGIDLPISGRITDTTIHTLNLDMPVAVIGDDFIGLKPTMKVVEGDRVKLGQELFEDKKNPGVVFCSPISGIVERIERGERRKLLSVIIRPEGNEAVGFEPLDVHKVTREKIVERLRISGTWPMFRTRPFSKIPKLDSEPFAIFVNTMDSNPLALDPLLALEGRVKDYQIALEIMCKLTRGNVHVCHGENANLPEPPVIDKIKYHTFVGVHPAGLVGTHIHYIEPVGLEKSVWHIGLQDMLAVGQLFRTGKIDCYKLVAIAGPGIKQPQIVRVNRGADIYRMVQNNLVQGSQRIISGSVFSGRKVIDETAYLGFYDQQISVLPEAGDSDSVFLEFVRPGANTYSKSRAYLGRFLRNKKLPFSTAIQGSHRAILPYGIYEGVTALDILPALLLKALAVKDTDTAINLGALELDEEDIALLTYVDPGKHDFGAILRENLTLIEEEG